MSTHHDDDVIGKAYDARLMRRLLTYLRPYRPQVALAIAAIVGNAALQLVPPYLTKTVIDESIPARDLSALGVDRRGLPRRPSSCRSSWSSPRPGRCRSSASG